MKTIRMADPGAAAALQALHDRLGLDQGLVTEAQQKLSGGRTPLEIVKEIVADVRARGDAAVSDSTHQLHQVRLSPAEFRVPQSEIDAAVRAMPSATIAAMQEAIANIRRYQSAMLAREPAELEVGGRRLAMVYRPLRRVAVYAPGGATAYPSSVLMTAVPAQVAGVEEVVLLSPPTERGSIRPGVLAACGLAGLTEVYRLGGVAGVAALAFGTPAVKSVDKIVGPSSLFVQLAKKEVLGHVDIDSFAGPSDVLVIADSAANPRYVAADLLSQAEHNPGSCVLVTDSAELLAKIAAELEAQVAKLEQAAVVRDALDRYGALILVADLAEACRVTNFLAPEHLQILTRRPRELLPQIRAAGAVFLGEFTPVAVGDYIAGPSHTLPTSGTARFASGLSANDFRKRMSVMEYSAAALAEDARHIAALASQEHFEAHGRSVTVRLEQDK